MSNFNVYLMGITVCYELNQCVSALTKVKSIAFLREFHDYLEKCTENKLWIKSYNDKLIGKCHISINHVTLM